MCGLVAAVGGNHEERARRAIDAMRYRGTRGPIVRVDRFWTIAHVRLPIVGLSEGNDQPVETPAGDVVAFVGEVLDYRETHPDAECDVHVVAEMWDALMDDRPSFQGRDGFWAVVGAEPGGDAIFALTDYLAQKPLYVRGGDGCFTVASEPASLAALGPTTRDDLYLSDVVKWGYCPDGASTPYREVRKIPPGTLACFRGGGGRSTALVDPVRPQPCSDPVFEVRDAIVRSTARRVSSSDVPVSILASGGLDSSIVAALAPGVPLLHVPNEGDEPPAGAEIVRTLDGASDDLVLDYMQEPVDLGSVEPQVALSNALGAQGVQVCLTGDGADELFGGYGRAQRYDSQASDVWRELVGYHLPRLDRVMMRNQVELRSPFLARRVVELALGLPRELRTGKLVLRRAFENGLPPEVAWGRKVPLKVRECEEDREARSARLVERFKERLGWT